MQYLMLIHQGDTPTPFDQEAWGRLSPEEQQQIYTDYQALNQTPGVTPGLGMVGRDPARTTILDPQIGRIRPDGRARRRASREDGGAGKRRHAWEDEDGKRGHETVVTVRFADQGGKTRLTFQQASFETPEARDGHAGGWAECFDRLSDYLAALRVPSET